MPWKTPLAPNSYRSPVAADTDYKLESVLISPQRRVAVINGTAVTEGGLGGCGESRCDPGAACHLKTGPKNPANISHRVSM